MGLSTSSLLRGKRKLRLIHCHFLVFIETLVEDPNNPAADMSTRYSVDRYLIAGS
jgi:hypothetical protein